MKANFLLLLFLLLFLFFCKKNSNAILNDEKVPPQVYFAPVFLHNVEKRETIDENGIPIGKTIFIVENDSIKVRFEKIFFDSISLLLPSLYKVEKDDSNRYIKGEYEFSKIEIFIDDIQAGFDTLPNTRDLIMSELSGIASLCKEQQNCKPLVYNGNLIEFDEKIF